MNYKTIIGGAACGVVALLCLPVCGAVGSVTALGAIIGAGCGGGAGAFASRGEKSAMQEATARGERNGRQQAKAEQAVWQQDIEEAFQRQEAEMDAYHLHDELVLSLIGYGLACAGVYAANPEIVEAIKDFACGQAISALPIDTLREIEALVASPPSREVARERADALPEVLTQRLDEMEQLVLALIKPADGAAYAA